MKYFGSLILLLAATLAGYGAQPRVGGVEVVRANGGLATNLVAHGQTNVGPVDLSKGATNYSATAPIHSVSGYTSGDGTENGFDGYIDVATGKIFAFTVTNVEQSVTNVFVGTWPLVPGWCWQLESTNNYLIRYTNGPCGGGGTQIWTNDADGTITAVSSVVDDLLAVGFSLNTDNPLSDNAIIMSVGSGGTNFFNVTPSGGLVSGRNTIADSGWSLADVFRAYRDAAKGDENNIYSETRIVNSANNKAAAQILNMYVNGLSMHNYVLDDGVGADVNLSLSASEIALTYTISEIVYTRLEPSASVTSSAYILDTTLTHTAGNLLEVRNNTTNKFFVTFNGTATARHFSGTTNASPTIAAGAGAGTGPTVSIVGGDTAGYISIVSGTLPSVSSVIATVTFGTAYADAPSVVLWPRNAAASVLTFLPYAVGGTTTWTFNAGSVGLGGSTTYEYNYMVMGTGNH